MRTIQASHKALELAERSLLPSLAAQSWSKKYFWSSSDNYDGQVQLYSEQRLLGYSCEQMFNVVSEVERYHSFVPWCKKSLVTVRTKDQQLKADLIVGFPPLFGESYQSTVTLFEPYLVTAVCTDMTMFNHLRTVWKFRPIEDDKNSQKCQLDFAVSFAFRSSVHSYFSRLFFDEVIKKNVKAFLTEAESRYGRESIPRQRPVVYAKG